MTVALIAGILQMLIIPAALGGWLTVDEIRRSSAGVWPRPISLQMAWSPARADAVIAAWHPPERKRIIRSINWDFGFIPSYAFFFAGLVSLPWEAPALLMRVLTVAMFAPLLAGAFDVIENIGMRRMIDNEAAGRILPRIVTFCSFTKFGLLIVTGIALTVALIASIVANV
jgi:hypothetical protein